MKKILFTLAVLLSSIAAHAQELPYQPLVVEGRTWVNVFEHNGETCGEFLFKFYLHGDSTVNGVTYKKLYMSVSNESLAYEFFAPLPCKQNGVIALMREENMRVYSIFDDGLVEYGKRNIPYNETTREFLLYDFVDLKQQVKKGWISQTQVEVGNTTCMEYEYRYVESIGCIYCGTLLDPFAEFADCEYYDFYYLNHVEDGNGNIIYKSVYYKDYSGVDDVKVTTMPSDDSYYNLQGQRVSEPAVGIYIHKGKKVIVK